MRRWARILRYGSFAGSQSACNADSRARLSFALQNLGGLCIEKAFFAIGTEIELAENLRFAFGFAGNSTYKFSMPFGITLCRFFKIMEIGIATNDILTFLSPGANPNASLSLSVFRLNVDKKKKK